ncbi:DNA-directed DNA polymerase, partial [Chytriomyces confervae]
MFHKLTKKRVQTQITGPIEELLDEYPNPIDTPPKGSISTVDLPDAPKSRKAMLLHPYRDYFLAAEKVELNAMNRKCVWKGGKYVKGRKLLRPKWIYSYKVDLDTKTVSRFKARLVTDIDTAYLNSDLDMVNYMSMPEGYSMNDQDGRQWNKHITATLIEQGFSRAKTDPCLFYKKGSKGFILLYVDDLIIMALTQGEVETIKSNLRKNFSIKELGEAKHILGMTIERVPGGIYLGQYNYAEEILSSMNMSDCDSKLTPMVEGWKHDPDSPKVSPEKNKTYHSCTMKVAYLANCTRPDISFTVNTLAQYQNDCREHDWNALIRVLRYIKGTWDHGLFYTKENGTSVATLHTNNTSYLDDPKWGSAIPQAYADASYAEDTGRKSRSGHVFMMANAAVTWFSKKQPVVALSSTEAEYYALSEAVKEALWVRQLLDEVGVKLNDPTTIHQDNMSTMAIALNPIQHQRVKHMDVK